MEGESTVKGCRDIPPSVEDADDNEFVGLQAVDDDMLPSFESAQASLDVVSLSTKSGEHDQTPKGFVHFACVGVRLAGSPDFRGVLDNVGEVVGSLFSDPQPLA
jgi:hypothetical protein